MTDKKVVDLTTSMAEVTVSKDEGRPKDQGRPRGSGRSRMTEEEFAVKQEEKLKKIEIVDAKVTGKVKHYNIMGHYGFIETEDGQDVFVHQTSIKSSKMPFYLRTLADNEPVQFDVGKTADNTFEAINVTGPDGADVIGSPYYMLQIRSFRLAYYAAKEARDKRRQSPKDPAEAEKHPRARRGEAQKEPKAEGDAQKTRTRGPRRRRDRKEAV
ncbi:unnamed protein product, partial [Mesorhabditis spiculigera]